MLHVFIYCKKSYSNIFMSIFLCFCLNRFLKQQSQSQSQSQSQTQITVSDIVKHAIPVVGFPTSFPSSCHREVDSATISGRGALGGGRGGVQTVRSVDVEGVGGVWR